MKSALLWLTTSLALLLPTAECWVAHFEPAALQLHMGNSSQVLLLLTDIEAAIVQQSQRYSFRVQSEAAHVASVSSNNMAITTDSWRGNITVEAHFLGKTAITVLLHDAQPNTSSTPSRPSNDDSNLYVTVVRPNRIIDHVFVGTVILLVSLLYINFGAALNMEVLRNLVVRPVAPAIGFAAQCCMPLLSYALGLLIFPNDPTMQLGLFFAGISPSGAASNTWTAVLGGNINLSVLMTTFSNLAAFATIPFWAFTVGQLTFQRAGIQIPYMNIATSAAALIVPLLIGLAIQRCSTRATRVLVRLLKPISMCLIIFIVVFAIVSNLYLFEIFSWQIVIAGLALPGLGYLLAWLLAKLLKQHSNDALTISIETGIHNTGIAILFLRTSLSQPEADLTTVVPVSVAIMTPFPLLGIYIYKRLHGNKAVRISRLEPMQSHAKPKDASKQSV